jgi:hypothetical protein
VPQNDIDETMIDLDMTTEEREQIESNLSYSKEYYILNREKLMEQKRVKMEEAKFGDFSARLVKRP